MQAALGERLPAAVDYLRPMGASVPTPTPTPSKPSPLSKDPKEKTPLLSRSRISSSSSSVTQKTPGARKGGRDEIERDLAKELTSGSHHYGEGSVGPAGGVRRGIANNARTAEADRRKKKGGGGGRGKRKETPTQQKEKAKKKQKRGGGGGK
jgi:hypothetical protein